MMLLPRPTLLGGGSRIQLGDEVSDFIFGPAVNNAMHHLKNLEEE